MTARQPSVPNLMFILRKSKLQIRQRRVVGIDNLTHFFDGGAHVVLAEQGRAGDKRVGTGTGALGDSLVIDTAVHLDAIGKLSFTPPYLGLLDFGQAFVDERLAAEARIDSHHKQQINLVEIRQDFGDGGGRIDSHADFFAERFNFPNERGDLLVKFDMDGDSIRASLGKRFDQNFRLRAHEVNVEKYFSQGTNGAHDFRPKGNVWDEMPVHDVEVQPVGAGTVGSFDFLAEAGVVGGEQRRRDNHARNLSE